MALASDRGRALVAFGLGVELGRVEHQHVGRNGLSGNHKLVLRHVPSPGRTSLMGVMRCDCEWNTLCVTMKCVCEWDTLCVCDNKRVYGSEPCNQAR